MPVDSSPPMLEILDAAVWRQRESSHRAEVAALVAGHEDRRAAGRPHPVEDFLFTYYRLRPSQLRHWHPGIAIGLRDAPEHAAQRFYRTDDGTTVVDAEAFVQERAETAGLVARLLTATAEATPQFGCLGLHEWAMVHRDAGVRRHGSWPLRLGADGTDEVLQRHQLRCTHYDAFRFFTEPAKPRNAHQPTVWTRPTLEQPGCLHANMDLYKWAYKMTPVVSSTLVLDCFRLAREVRELDMRASPYDLSELGYRPVAIETTEGKTEYVAAQRDFAARAALLRERLLTAIQPVIRILAR